MSIITASSSVRSGPQALFDRARMWAVRDAARVQRNRRALDAFAAAEVAVDVVEHLVAIDVAMVIGNGNRERMIIQLARHKRADDEVGPLEGLMHWRRLMDAPGNRLKIGNIEDPGILAAIPANGIDG